MQGRLFTEYFLTEGIRETPEWRASLDDATAFDAFRHGLRARHDALSAAASPNEAATEQDLIRPVLELLGWADYLPQQGADRNEDIPDHLLFADSDEKNRAAQRPAPADRYRDALVVQESKRFALSLDARGGDSRRRSGTPHGQILRYLNTAIEVSDGRIRWGILTNGRVWRLYDGRARPRATAYFEIDLADTLERDDRDRLRVFQLLFRRNSFTPTAGATATFLEAALAEGRRYEERVAQDLSSVVFERAFPRLVEALAKTPGADLAGVRHAALIFLYRLLFVLYAEDRGLLPVNDARYDDYGLRLRVRDDVDRRTRDGDTFSTVASSYYDHFATCASSSTRATRPSACRPTTAACSPRTPLRCWGPPACRTPPWPPSSTTSATPSRTARPGSSTTATCRPAARLHLRAPARARAGPRPGRQHRHPPQRLRPQGQRQLLHPPGTGRPHHRPHPQAPRRRAPRGVRE